jgi:hypothetical protein
MTLDEIRATKEYLEGWTVYSPYFENNCSWPPGLGRQDCPYKSGISSDLWYCGANSAYGNRYHPGTHTECYEILLARSEPTYGRRSTQEQLCLFD